jgi:hypothetical protein
MLINREFYTDIGDIYIYIEWFYWFSTFLNFSHTHCILPLLSYLLWRARCRSTVNSGNACWQPLLGKQHVICFLCGLTPACYATMWRLRFLRGLFRGNNSQCNSECFLCGLFTGYIAGHLRGQLVSNGKGRHKSQLAAKQRVQQLRVHELREQFQLRVSVKTRQVW